MAEGLAATPGQIAAFERDALLATKLHVPGSRLGLVPRPRLAERLDEGLGRGLVLVCAPAGYGKTVALAEWARRRRCPAAWLSLDAGDNDPARFWRHVVAALDRARPGIGERIGPLLGPPAPVAFEPLVTALINELADQPGEDVALLVLDDYHLIGAEPVHTSFGFLLEHRPPGMYLVLASRTDPPLALARLRASGQLAELRDVELRFTAGEAAVMLREAAGAHVPDASVAALAARTEGWAAGLQLAGLSLRGQEDVTGFVAAFTGSHRFVLDFLAEEVLERQSEQVRRFLLETSVLERLSGDLCDAVTGRPGSQALLEQAERAGLFLVPLDEVRGWWRYHHLFADLLRARLQQEQPGGIAQLHRNAAAWHEEHGLADDAIRHAVAAGEMAWAARLIERHFDTVFYLRGEGATVQRWLSGLPDDLVRCRPRLLLAQASLANASGRADEVEQLIDAAERASAGAAEEPFEPTVGRANSMLVNVPALIALDRSHLAQLRGDTEGTAAFASRALAESGESEWLLSSIARGFLAVAEWHRGLLADAESALASSIGGWQAAGQPTVTAWGGYQLGQVQRAQGRLDAAVGTYRRALDATAPPGRPPLPPPAPHMWASARWPTSATNSTAPSSMSPRASRCAVGSPTPRRWPPGWSRRRGSGRPPVTRPGHWTRSTRPHRPRRARPARSTSSRPSERGCCWPRATWPLPPAGRQSKVSARTTEPDYAREPEYLVLARVLLAEGRPGPALKLLDRLHTAAAAQHRAGSLIEVGALRALALAAGGQQAAAVDALAGALILACPHGHVRVFADEGPPMAALLRLLITAQRTGEAAAEVPLGCLVRLQHAFGSTHATPDPGQSPAAATPGLVEPLTGRELEVLGMLAAGRSNQAIASELVVTLNTVKKHVSHILGKLGAASRTEAVARARELGLIR